MGKNLRDRNAEMVSSSRMHKVSELNRAMKIDPTYMMRMLAQSHRDLCRSKFYSKRCIA